jgi:hypothetical protein
MTINPVLCRQAPPLRITQAGFNAVGKEPGNESKTQEQTSPNMNDSHVISRSGALLHKATIQTTYGHGLETNRLPGASWSQASLLLALSISLLSGATTSTFAGTLTTDFSSDPGGTELSQRPSDETAPLVRDGVLKLVDLADLVDPSTGLVNDTRKPLRGSYIFPALDPGKRVQSFVVNFKARVGGGTESPAEGFSLVLANDYDSSAPFREGGGSTTGLTISFKTINGVGADSEAWNQTDPPGIYVKQKGVVVTSRAYSKLATDGAGTTSIPKFVLVNVTLTADGLLSVNYNGDQVFDKAPIGYFPIEGQFGFGAGTEGQAATLDSNFWIDDLSITTTTVSGAYVVSAAPPTQGALPNASIQIGIQGLNGASVQMTLDGASVSPSTSDAGNGVTLVTYTPASPFHPGSTHSTKVTFGTQTFQYGFTVTPATLLTPDNSIDPTTVDTSVSGFHIRIYQTGTFAIGSNSDAEAVLAGSKGPNIASASSADVNGGINFELTGTDAGGVPGDTTFPGIPGTAADGTSTTDNFAMEATGYLVLNAGSYTFGVNSDDGFKLTAGANPRDVTALSLATFGGPRAPAESTGTVVVQQSGTYPVRLLYWNASGGAEVDFYVIDASGNRTLVNDPNAPAASRIKSYRQLKAGVSVPPYVSAANPAPNDLNVSVTPTVTLQLTENTTTLNPTSVKLLIDNSQVTLSTNALTKTGSVTTVTYTVAQPLTATASHSLQVQFADNAGNNISRQWTFTTGQATAGNALNSVKVYWTAAKGTLKSRIGRDLEYVDPTLASDYQFGVTGQGASSTVPSMTNGPAHFIKVPYLTDPANVWQHLGLRVKHSIAPNGGGTKVNQFTAIFDLMWGDGSGYGAVWQLHDLANGGGDSDMYWQQSSQAYGKSCCSTYTAPNKKQDRWQWARVVFAVDLSANPPVLAKYIDGVKNFDSISGSRAHVDSEFALSIPEIVLFADSDNENSDAYLSAFQLREGRMSDDEIAGLGTADPNGIPLPYSNWNFDQANPLAASVGNDLQYVDPSQASLYTVGLTGQGSLATVPGINGQPTAVIKVPYLTQPDVIWHSLGLIVPHGLAPNGGGQKVNQYTAILDLMWGDGSGYGALWQLHDLANGGGDADMYWQQSSQAYGKSCCSTYTAPNQKQDRWQWARVVLAVDLAANPPVLAKYINGLKNFDAISGSRAHVDSEFAFSLPNIVLFGDSDNENSDAYLAHFQVRQGRMSDDEIAALGGPTVAPIPTPNPVKGEWNFDDPTNPLAATVGADMQFVDPSQASLYTAGVTGQGGLSTVAGINGQPTTVIKVPYLTQPDGIWKKLGLRVFHGMSANGGGQKVNQYTAILDLMWGDGSGYGALWQLHDLDNGGGDADMYWQQSSQAYGKSCCSTYTAPNQKQDRWQWARVTFAVDLAANPPILAKYINGVKNFDAISGSRAHLDSEFAFSIPEIVLFGDSDNENSDAYLSAFQVREGRMSEGDIAALGGPDPTGIPSASIGAVAAVTPPVTNPPKIALGLAASNLTISWDASASGFTLESTPTLAKPITWTTVSGVANNSVTITIGPGTKFYRLRK